MANYGLIRVKNPLLDSGLVQNVILTQIIFDGNGNERTFANLDSLGNSTNQPGTLLELHLANSGISKNVITGALANAAAQILVANATKNNLYDTNFQNRNVQVIGNIVDNNGTHRESNALGGVSCDGIAGFRLSQSRIMNNTFHDNTDVALILGQCPDCVISYNKFTHSEDPMKASFAEMMLGHWVAFPEGQEAYPLSHGEYARSEISYNGIDCGAKSRCGYGIKVGHQPWYSTKWVSGVSLSNNAIGRTRVPISIDGATGVALKGNHFEGFQPTVTPAYAPFPGIYSNLPAVFTLTKPINLAPLSTLSSSDKSEEFFSFERFPIFEPTNY
jgi:hypothetical protein